MARTGLMVRPVVSCCVAVAVVAAAAMKDSSETHKARGLPHCDEKERVAYPVTDEVWIAHIGALLHHVAALDVRVA